MQSQRPRNRSRSGVVRGGDALPVRQLMLELVLLLEPWSTDTSTSSGGKGAALEDLLRNLENNKCKQKQRRYLIVSG